VATIGNKELYMPSLGSTSFVDIFSSPQLVFDRIRAKSLPFWPPLLVIVAVLSAFMAWYFMTVDMNAYMETTLVLADQEMTPEAFDAAMATANIVRIISPIAAPLVSLLIYLILATFFFLAATLVAEEKFRFGQFFTLVCWASLPGLVSTLSMAVSYAVSPDYVFLNLLDKTNLASLMGLAIGDATFALYASVSIGAIWSYLLYGLGFARITGSAAVTATLVGLVPPAVQFSLIYFL
jgi:hypothetical protein